VSEALDLAVMEVTTVYTPGVVCDVELVIPLVVSGDSAVGIESEVILELADETADGEGLAAVVGADGAELVTPGDKGGIEVEWVRGVRELEDGVELLTVGVVEVEEGFNSSPEVD